MDPIITVPQNASAYASADVVPVTVQVQVSSVSKTSIAQIKKNIQTLQSQLAFQQSLLTQVTAAVPVINEQN